MPDSSPLHSISGGGYRAEVSALGAALRGLIHDGPRGPYALAEGRSTHDRPLHYAGAVLCPWPGGIRDGRFFFDGIEHELAVTDPTRAVAVHGFAWHRPWTLVSSTPSRIEQSLELGLHKGWPYRLTATTVHEVGPGGLTVTHTVTNVGEYHAPLGFGVHPYVTAGAVPLDDCTLEIAAGVRLPLDAERVLPNAYTEPVAGTEFDFSSPRPLRETCFDLSFSALDVDLDGIVRHRLHDPNGDGTMLWTDAGFGWLHAKCSTSETVGENRSLVLAPSTCPPDAFNLGIDMLVLQAGDTWTGRWGLKRSGPNTPSSASAG